jgi:GAF domain-containing protein
VNLALASGCRRAVGRTRTDLTATAADLDRVMAVVVRRARELADAGGALIELESGVRRRVVSGAARTQRLGSRLARSASLREQCWAAEEPVVCADANYDPRLDAAACRRAGAISLLCVPLRHAGRVVGVLEVSDPRPRAFAARDAEALRLLGEVVTEHLGGRESADGAAGARPAAAA